MGLEWIIRLATGQGRDGLRIIHLELLLQDIADKGHI